MGKTVQESIPTEEEYFKPVSDAKCPFCGRFLLYDPREEMTVEIGHRLRAFFRWVHDVPRFDLEIMARRDKYNGDELIWLCGIHGPCHEGCDYDFHETKGIPIK